MGPPTDQGSSLTRGFARGNVYQVWRSSGSTKAGRTIQLGKESKIAKGNVPTHLLVSPIAMLGAAMLD
jgi:hypothetical protein